MTVDPEHYRRLERMYATAPTNAYYRPELRIGEATATIRVQVREEFFHAAGAVHGSVYFKLLDDAAFFAVNSLITDVFVLTTSFQTYLTRPVSSGALVAEGHVVSRTRRLYVAEAVLRDDRGREVGRGSGTFMPSQIPLDARVNYA